MGVKVVGAVLLLLAGLGWGFAQAGRWETRVRRLRSLGLALSLLEKEVAVGATHLPDALRRCSRVAEPAVARFLEGVVARLSDGKGRTAPQAWEEALQEETGLGLFPPDLEIVRGFGVTLGSSGRSDQVKRIALTRERLDAQERMAQEEARRQGKLYRYLGFLVPAALLLALW